MKLAAVVVIGVLAIALGAAGVVLGEADDSPGLQGLGVLLILGSLFVVGRRIAQRTR